MAPIKLYGEKSSSCTARAMICLEEMGAPYELVPVDFLSREHKRPPHIFRNPFGAIPAMEDGDLTLFESRAISKYVARKYAGQGRPDLLGQGGGRKETAVVDAWMEAEGQSYSPAVSALVFQLLVVPRLLGGQTDEGVVAASEEALARVLDVYEERLSRAKYLAGDSYSLADQHHLPYTYYLMTTSKAHLLNSRPHVKAWWEDISSRPAFKKVAAGMDLGGTLCL